LAEEILVNQIQNRNCHIE